jgi:dTMP kinase
MLLYMASRAQLMEERIEPAIASRACVLSDRFVGSTLAYQGAAGGIPERDIRAVAQVAIGGRWPDLNVLFDVDTETAMKRLNPLLDRMEGKGMDFHRRVRDGYLAEAHRDPKRHLVIDASRSPDEVFEQLINGLRRWSESFSPAVAG